MVATIVFCIDNTFYDEIDYCKSNISFIFLLTQ